MGQVFVGTGVNRLVQKALSFLTSLMTANLLGPLGRGIVSVLFSLVTTFETLTRCGQDMVVPYLVGRQKHDFAAVVIASFLINSALALLLSLLVFCFLSGTENLASWSYLQEYYPVISEYKGWLLLAAGLTLLSQFSHSLYRGLLLERRFKTYNYVKFFEVLPMPLCLALAYIVFGISVESTIYSLLITNVTTFITLLFLLRQRLKIQTTWAQITANFQYGWRLYLNSIAGFLHARVDLMMIGLFLPFDQAGYYSVALVLADVLLVIPSSINAMLSSETALSSEELSNQRTAKVCRCVVALTLSSAVVLWFACQWLVIPFMFPAYEASLQPLFWLLLAVLGHNLSHMIFSDLIGRGHGRVMSWCYNPFVVFNILANLWAIPRFGIAGAALTSALSYGGTALAAVISFRVINKVPLWQLVIPRSADWQLMLGQMKSYLRLG